VFSLANSVVNITLPEFAAERRMLRPVLQRRWWRPRRCRSISPAQMALSSKPAARRCCSGLTGKKTYGETPESYINPAPHTTGTTPMQLLAIMQLNS